MTVDPTSTDRRASWTRALAIVLLVMCCCALAVDLVLGAVVAPAAFAHAAPRGPVFTRDQAGLFFGEVLARWSALGGIIAWFVAALAGAVAWLVVARRPVLAVLLPLAALALIGCHQVSAGVVAEGLAYGLKAVAGQVSVAEEVHFKLEVHPASMRWFALEMAALAAISVLAGWAAFRTSAATGSPTVDHDGGASTS